MTAHTQNAEKETSGFRAEVTQLLDLIIHSLYSNYATFWKAFGRVLKEEITEDATNRETLASLLRFASTYTSREAQEVSFYHRILSIC